jgi:CheY-like chemotaxis protein
MKVLIVDDELEVGRALERVLQYLGHVPVRADHPDQALLLLTGDVDAVITDIDMPGMNGVELARRIRARDARIPIAFCTGSQPGEQAVQAAADIGPVLTKVWTLQQVEQLLLRLERDAARTR